MNGLIDQSIIDGRTLSSARLLLKPFRHQKCAHPRRSFSVKLRTRDSNPCCVGLSVRWLVCPSIRPFVTFLNCERFSHYHSCPTVRDWIPVYPALFFSASCVKAWKVEKYRNASVDLSNISLRRNFMVHKVASRSLPFREKLTRRACTRLLAVN